MAGRTALTPYVSRRRSGRRVPHIPTVCGARHISHTRQCQVLQERPEHREKQHRDGLVAAGQPGRAMPLQAFFQVPAHLSEFFLHEVRPLKNGVLVRTYSRKL